MNLGMMMSISELVGWHCYECCCCWYQL